MTSCLESHPLITWVMGQCPKTPYRLTPPPSPPPPSEEAADGGGAAVSAAQLSAGQSSPEDEDRFDSMGDSADHVLAQYMELAQTATPRATRRQKEKKAYRSATAAPVFPGRQTADCRSQTADSSRIIRLNTVMIALFFFF